MLLECHALKCQWCIAQARAHTTRTHAVGPWQALDTSWKGKVESLVEELQREKAAGKDVAAKAAAADAEAQACIRSLNASLAKAEQGLAAKAKEAEE